MLPLFQRVPSLLNVTDLLFSDSPLFTVPERSAPKGLFGASPDPHSPLFIFMCSIKISLKPVVCFICSV